MFEKLGKKLGKTLLGNEEERAVSPVIGVILMVAITVILAAVIAAFVLDMGNDLGGDDVPNSVWSTSYSTPVADADEEVLITFTHDSGDTIDSDNLELNDFTTNYDVKLMADGNIAAGDTVTVVTDGQPGTADSTIIPDGEDVSLVWNDGSSSSTLSTHEVSEDIKTEP